MADQETRFDDAMALYDNNEYDKAVALLQTLAEEGDDRAQNSLGDCYYYGKGVAQDYETAFKWYTKAAEHVDLSKTRSMWDQGNIDAQYSLGYCYYHGKGVAQDFKNAAGWLYRAANQGHTEAQFRLGMCYYNGEGVLREYGKAFDWWQKAAEHGHAEARELLNEILAKMDKDKE